MRPRRKHFINRPNTLVKHSSEGKGFKTKQMETEFKILVLILFIFVFAINYYISSTNGDEIIRLKSLLNDYHNAISRYGDLAENSRVDIVELKPRITQLYEANVDLELKLWKMDNPQKYKLLSSVRVNGKKYTITSAQVTTDYGDSYYECVEKCKMPSFYRSYTLKRVDPSETIYLKEDKI